MNTRTVITTLYDYGEWANERLLALAAKLADGELRRRPSKGCQSIHESFVHLLSADARWLARSQAATLPPIISPEEVPTLADVRDRWASVAEARRRYLAGLREEDLEQPIRGRTIDGQEFELPRWQGLLQCANHGTQHRAEIALMLTDAGHSPGDLDYSLYCRTRGA